jgi:hypothetical protein
VTVIGDGSARARMRRIGTLALAIAGVLIVTTVAVSGPASGATPPAKQPPTQHVPPPGLHVGNSCSAAKEATYRQAGFTCYKKHLYRLLPAGYLKVGEPCAPKRELAYEANGFTCSKHKLASFRP